METRTIQSSDIKNNEVYRGNLRIQGDISADTKITLEDGFLDIDGDVGDGVEIKLIFSGTKGSTVKNEACAGSTRSRGNERWVNSGVNIDNRIFTDDDVYYENGKPKYKITAHTTYVEESIQRDWCGRACSITYIDRKGPDRKAIAVIDGCRYEGDKIEVDGLAVLVDGITVAGQKLLIRGNVGNNVVINSDAAIEVIGLIGCSCEISSRYSGLVAKNIGDESRITMFDSISVDTVGNKCVLISEKGELKAKNLEDKVTICTGNNHKRNWRDIAGSVGERCYFNGDRLDVKRSIKNENEFQEKSRLSLFPASNQQDELHVKPLSNKVETSHEFSMSGKTKK